MAVIGNSARKLLININNICTFVRIAVWELGTAPLLTGLARLVQRERTAQVCVFLGWTKWTIQILAIKYFAAWDIMEQQTECGSQ